MYGKKKMTPAKLVDDVFCLGENSSLLRRGVMAARIK